MILQGREQLVKERAVDDPYNWLFLVQEAYGDARKGETVHKVRSSICDCDQFGVFLELEADQRTDWIDAKRGGIC